MTKTSSTLPGSSYPRGNTNINAVKPIGQREIITWGDTSYRIEETNSHE